MATGRAAGFGAAGAGKSALLANWLAHCEEAKLACVALRLLTRRTVLWTEMICDDTLMWRKDIPDYFLGLHDVEHPIVAQLGGNRPESMADAAAMCEAFGYDEVNLNAGCPSSRVSREGRAGGTVRSERLRKVWTKCGRSCMLGITLDANVLAFCFFIHISES